jgi:hypothetical protein
MRFTNNSGSLAILAAIRRGAGYFFRRFEVAFFRLGFSSSCCAPFVSL